MKIALVNHNLGSGGAEKLIHDMAIEMKNKGEDVSVVLLTSKNGVYDNSLLEKGIKVIHLSDKWDIYNPINIIKLIKKLREYDIVHTHIYSAQLWTAFASYFLPKKIKYITTEHNTTNSRRGKWYFKLLDKWMYQRYDSIVTITQEVQECLTNWIGESKLFKMEIVKNGIFLENYSNASPLKRELLKLTDSNKVIVMIARFDKQKDHKTIVNAMQYLDSNYKLLLIGKGELENEIKIQVKKLSLDEKIDFLGYRKDIPEILKMADVCVLSSHYEGLPISALEAMASGIPFVATKAPGLKDLVVGAGEVFEPENSLELSEIIKKICTDDGYRLEISKKCMARAKEYDIKETVKEYINIYKIRKEIQ